MWLFNLQPFLEVECAEFPTLQLRGLFLIARSQVHLSIISNCWYGKRKKIELVSHIVLETKSIYLEAFTVFPQKNIIVLPIPISEAEMLI